MLTASVLWGILLSTNALRGRVRPAWLLDLHRWLGGLTVGFVAVHLGALVADSFVHFGPVDLLVPYASHWRPSAVAFGVVALWLLAAVEVSSLLRKHISPRAWHAIHLGSYVTFWLASIHASMAGSDASQPLYRTTSVLALVAVVFATTYRLLTSASARNEVTRSSHS
jgi:DMSO/TMAO reductase YedYZ heme-binding membrane subunit